MVHPPVSSDYIAEQKHCIVQFIPARKKQFQDIALVEAYVFIVKLP